MMGGTTMDYAAARGTMVASQLRPEGVTDTAVLAAMARVPREDHVADAQKSMAYMDRPLTVDGSPMMAPADLGRLLGAIAPRPGERALVVGAGGGYSAALLSSIGLSVDRAVSIGANLTGKYDVILVEGAIPAVPAALCARLSDNGRIGAAIVERGVARMSIGRGDGSGVGFKTIGDIQIPILPGSMPEPVFQF